MQTVLTDVLTRYVVKRMSGLVTAGLLAAASMASQASVVYTYSAAGMTIGYQNEGPFQVGHVNDPTMRFPGSASASFELATALAPNTTTTLRSELGGYDLIGQPNTGGVLKYEAAGIAFPGISSDVNRYLRREDAQTYTVFLYSEMEGTVTTDAGGNIVAWALNFFLYNIGGEQFLWKGPGAPPPGFPTLSRSFLEMAVFTNSESQLLNLSVNVLNGVVSDTTIEATVYDRVFGDAGPSQLTRYNTRQGVWSADEPNNPVPIPALAALLSLGVFGLVRTKRQ